MSKLLTWARSFTGTSGTTDNAVLRGDGTGGTGVQGSVLIVDDSGNVSGMADLSMSGNRTHATAIASIAGNTSEAGLVVIWGSGSGFTTGDVYYLNTSGAWVGVDADAQASAHGLVAVALGATAASGMVLEGLVDMAGGLDGAFVKGGPLYLHTDTGEVSFTAPSGSGDIVRVVGWGSDTANVVYWRPSGTFVEVA